MAREIISSIMTSAYSSDLAENFDGVGFRLAKPADLADSVIDDILAAVNARRKTPADSTPCPVADDFTPRKLRFVRRDGNSFSVGLYNKGFAIAAATAIRNAVNAASTANPVLCVELIGESWADTMFLLSTRTAAPTPGTASRVTSGGKQTQHSGQILYEYDGGNAATIPLAVKADTDAVAAGVTSPPSIVSSEWNLCVGPFEPKIPCPSRAGMLHRRFIATLMVTAVDGGGNPTGNPYYQKTEIPNKGHETSDIRACGAALSNNPSVVCLGYQGEINKRLHLLLT